MPLDSQYLPLQRLYHWESKHSNAIHLVQPFDGGKIREFTWAQALNEARRIAAWLQTQGLEPGAHIAILSKNSAWWYITDYAIMIAGFVSVPLYPNLNRESVHHIVEHADVRLCFVGKLDNPDEMEAGLPPGLILVQMPLARETAGRTKWDDIIASTAPLQGQPVQPADALMTIVYTSGTTGGHKGVMHTFSSLGSAGHAVIAGWDLRMLGERHLSFLPAAHLADRWANQQVALQTGGRVYFAESIESFITDIQRARPTVFGCVPRLWVKFQQGVFAKQPKARLDFLFRIPLVGRMVKRKILQQLGLDQIRFAVSGAAPMPPDLLTWYRALGLELLELYGMSENSGLSHCTRRGQVRVGYVGVPFDGVQARLSDIGEVQVKSPGDTPGYYKAPELTAELFTEDGFIRTGDLGELDEQGRLRIIGRVKEQFKTSKGKYVAPTQIENLLVTHPSVEACCVAGAGLTQPFGLLMLSEPELLRSKDPEARAELQTSLEELIETSNAQLSRHEHIDFVVVSAEQWTVDNGLITPTFKVKRMVIEKLYGAQFEKWATQNKKVIWL